MILYIILGFVVLLVIAIVAAERDSRRIASRVANRIQAMEQKYENYIEKSIVYHILDKDDFELEEKKLIEDVIQTLKPDIDGIISLINSTIYTSVSIPYDSNYFPNLVGLCENYFRQSQQNKNKQLTPKEEENFLDTLGDAIQADMKKRILKLKLGGL